MVIKVLRYGKTYCIAASPGPTLQWSAVDDIMIDVSIPVPKKIFLAQNKQEENEEKKRKLNVFLGGIRRQQLDNTRRYCSRIVCGPETG